MIYRHSFNLHTKRWRGGMQESSPRSQTVSALNSVSISNTAQLLITQTTLQTAQLLFVTLLDCSRSLLFFAYHRSAVSSAKCIVLYRCVWSQLSLYFKHCSTANVTLLVCPQLGLYFTLHTTAQRRPLQSASYFTAVSALNSVSTWNTAQLLMYTTLQLCLLSSQSLLETLLSCSYYFTVYKLLNC